MTVLVTGGSGLLGGLVVAELDSRGMPCRSASRTSVDSPLDLATGLGLPEAVEGVSAVIHCASDPSNHGKVDVEGTRLLREATDAHIVFASIVGCDVVPLPYYRSKVQAEELVSTGAHSILRGTQFHQLVWQMAARLAKRRLVVVPKDTRYQTLDPVSMAQRLVDAVEFGPGGRLPDIGGRFAYEMTDLTRSYLKAKGLRRRLIRRNRSGLVGAALRAGGNLTPSRDETGESWNDFVARQL